MTLGPICVAEGKQDSAQEGQEGWGDLVGRQGIFAGASLQPEGAECLLESRLELFAVISREGAGGRGQARRGGKGGR